MNQTFIWVPGQNVLYGVNDVKVKDYAAYAAINKPNNTNWDQSWKNRHSFRYLDHPVTKVTWHDAVSYCEWLTKTDKMKAYNQEYRLPTEREWEEALGLPTHNNNGATNPVWSRMNIPGNYGPTNVNNEHIITKTSPVGEYGANAYGLYDMVGNVLQWCNKVDAPDKIICGVARGISYISTNHEFTLSSTHSGSNPDTPEQHIGFRVVIGRKSLPAYGQICKWSVVLTTLCVLIYGMRQIYLCINEMRK